MDFRRLRYLIQVGEARSFTRAARSLNVSQPTLSQQIQDLEAELGVTLFIRSAHKVEPTEAGLLTIDCARRVLAEVEGLREAVLEHRGLKRGRLRIGVTQTFNALYLPRIVTDFARDYPAIDLEILELANDEIDAGVEAGTLHLGVGLPRAHTKSRAEPLYADTLMLVCARESRLGEAEEVPASYIAQESLALLGHGFRTRAAADDYLAEAKVTPLRILAFNTFAAILNVVATGEYVSIVPADVRHVSGVATLHFARLAPAPPLRTICLLSAPDGRATPAALRLAARIRDHFAASAR
ncbi:MULTISPECIES: LysR substrate-binding domain-containing protein [Methylosinus]|uniref:LysR family transcriptional regulator n=1 Tax=Methylosinus trichosporium (strain ATCC 35070 / NCIMB 11131 / UNIQEM 75 / OB3b) TaxID=595536 RepID=A0A2D2D283_METT3|nr:MULTISPECIES: LysR substrate-binding domain-containing protein [Methylosinus]ATQ69105.1 LysR family transcriptional regulator [Methylosinus trichosporium OB3b]OBS54222.1 LysR family transcriptional regulator [Methylosinus sp. 3S-1]